MSAAEKEHQQLLTAQSDYQDKSLDAERDYQEKLTEIAADGAEKRMDAERKQRLAALDSRAGFYAGLAGMEDQDLAQQLSAQYEHAAAQAAEIARTQGADVAQQYLAAQQQAIQDQSAIQQDIAEAEADQDGGRAEYLRGLLTLQQDADAERLKQITESGDSLAATEARQYAEAERRYSAHLDRLGQTYAKKAGELPGLGATLGAAPAGAGRLAPPAGSATAPASPTGPTQVVDINAQQALDSGLGRLEATLAAIAAGVAAVERRVGDVEGAVKGLGRTSALARG